MRRFIQIIDTEVPRNTGLFFEIQNEIDEIFWVKDIIDEQGNELFVGGFNKKFCKEFKTELEGYCDIMLERTRIILKFQKDK